MALKRDLWDGLLREAYGESVGEDSLFLQHTYLTVVVKAVAAVVLDVAIDDPAALLTGRGLTDEGILGAVEADFFDCVLRDPAGAALVRRIAREAARFRLRDPAGAALVRRIAREAARFRLRDVEGRRRRRGPARWLTPVCHGSRRGCWRGHHRTGRGSGQGPPFTRAGSSSWIWNAPEG